MSQESEEIETVRRKRLHKRREEAALAKIKQSKSFKRQKKSHEGEPEGDDEDLAWDMYTKKAPLPGQLENCEFCEKRFTVTPYSKTGAEGGLLCAKCSKEQEAQRKKKEGRPKKQPAGREKRRQTQSNLLDGILDDGAKTLLDMCIKVGRICLGGACILQLSTHFGCRLSLITSTILMNLVIFHPRCLIV